MKYLLDTDVLSLVARDANAALTQRVRACAPSDLALSVVTRGEVEFGLLFKKPKRLTEQRMRGLMGSLQTLPLTPDVALHYAQIRAALNRAGTPIGVNDMWIAAHAKALGLALVSNNRREFDRVPGLALEHWLA